MRAGKKPKRSAHRLGPLLGLTILCCGIVARATAPVQPHPDAAAQLPVPSASILQAETPPPEGVRRASVARQYSLPALTASAKAEAQPEVLFMPTFIPADDIAPEATATPTASPAHTPQPAATPQSTLPPGIQLITEAPLSADDPTPLPEATPSYAYEAGGTRVEVTRHDIKNVVYYTAEIWLEDPAMLRSAFSSDRFDSATEPVLDIAVRNDAILAINGDFATFNSGGIIIRNGELFRANKSSRQTLVIDRDGNFSFYKASPEDPKATAETLIAEGALHTFVFGPVLIENGEAIPIWEDFFLSDRALEPRTALLQLGPLHYMFLIVDGRIEGHSQGVSIVRLQELCLEHGAIAAFNLDGGGSTTLFFGDEIINKPANGGQRKVSDILFIPR